MAASRYHRAKPIRVRKPVVLLATEGSHTEVVYFQELKKTHRQVVTVLISGGKPGELNPKRVLKRLRDEVLKHRRNKDWLRSDSAWLVVDTDQWPEEERQEILREAREGDFQLAASNPCFEVWLLLHFFERHGPRQRRRICENCWPQTTASAASRKPPIPWHACSRKHRRPSSVPAARIQQTSRHGRAREAREFTRLSKPSHKKF